jgi:hypothetical protein
MGKFVLSLVCTVLMSNLAFGQCASTYRARTYSSYSTYNYVTPTYVAPTYVAPYVAPVVKKEVVVEKVVVPVFNKYVAVIPIVEFPTYGAFYSAPYNPYAYPPNPAGGFAGGTQPNPGVPNPGVRAAAPPAPTAQSDDIRQILDLMKGLDSRIRRLEDGSAPRGVPKEAPKELPKKEEDGPASAPGVREIILKKCAGCHSKSNADKYGAEKDKKGIVLCDEEGNLLNLSVELISSSQDHVYANTMPKVNARSKELKITPLTDTEAGVIMAELSRLRKLKSKTRSDLEIAAKTQVPFVVQPNARVRSR